MIRPVALALVVLLALAACVSTPPGPAPGTPAITITSGSSFNGLSIVEIRGDDTARVLEAAPFGTPRVVATHVLDPGSFEAARALLAAELPRLRLPPEEPPLPDSGSLVFAFDPPIAGRIGVGASDPVPPALTALHDAVLRATFRPGDAGS